MENSDSPGVRGEPGGHRASGRGRDSPDAHFFFADAIPGTPFERVCSTGGPLCRNPLGDRQVLKGVTQRNVTILDWRGSIGDDR